MASQEESQGITVQATGKKAFLAETFHIQRELGKCQREYKKVISIRLKSRSEQILDKSYIKTITSLLSERNDLRAQIWVADGKPFKDQNERYMELIQCHIKCQEHLTADIQKLKVYINHLESEISYTDKEIYLLNRKTVPDTQHQDYVKRMRTKMSIMENRLEVGTRRESGFTAANAVLRDELSTLLDYREFFNDSFLKLIQKLNIDKKYMLELLKYAASTFDDCINVHEKIDNSVKKTAKERDNLKAEMQSAIRKSVANDESVIFIQAKNHLRELAPLDPKEVLRRKTICHTYQRKIGLYNNVLSKLLKYTKSLNVDSVIETFQSQESAYYSYYTLAIEIGYHITLLKNAVNRLYRGVAHLRRNNRAEHLIRGDKIAELEKVYEDKKKRNEALRIELETKDRSLENLFQEFTNVFNSSNCSAAPLTPLLGETTKVNSYNLRLFLKILEARVLGMVATVYIRERTDSSKVPEKYVVKDIQKYMDYPTDLDDIVLTQQCPECAEGEAFNTDDVDGGIIVHTMEEAKRKLAERVNQPEMQYRLHNISQCRLPRSHLLIAKRYE